MLKVALPRPTSDAVFRGEGCAPPPRASRPAWDDEASERPVRPFTRAEAQAFDAADPPLSPWRVVAAQVAFGALAGLAGAAFGGEIAAMSALYGAAVVALPGALMARGATSRLSSISPVVSALSLLWWGFVKLAVTIAMLVLAARIVPGLVWPVMLVSMVLCMQTYWFALLWRGRSKR